MYEVTVERTVYVLADSEASAERWAEHHSEDDDGPTFVHAIAIAAAPPSVRESLPWCADGVPDGAESWTVGDWLARGES